MNENEKQRLLTEIRQLAVAQPVLEEILGRKKQAAFLRLLASYRDGTDDLRNNVAELFIIHSIEEEIKGKLASYDTLNTLKGK